MKQRTAGVRFLPAAIVAALGGVALLLWWAQPRDAVRGIADRLAGERWYAVVYRHTPIGHYRAAHGRTPEGDFEFRTELRFRLAGDTPTRIEDRLVFHRTRPHVFVRGENLVATGDSRREVVVEPGTATVIANGAASERPIAADFALGDYLAVEQWLAEEAPALGAATASLAIDFDRLALVEHRWRLQQRETDGAAVIEAATPSTRADALGFAAPPTRIRLDRLLAPSRMDMGNLFSIRRVSNADTARAWESSPPLFAAGAHRATVDQRIANPSALRRITLAVEPRHVQAFAWLGATPDGLLSGSIEQRPVADASELAEASAVTASYPADDERVRELAAQAVAGIERTGDKADALARFVHGLLRYHDAPWPRTVFDTLRERRGDCTEFADLYAVLGRAVGLPTRTVTGLVYRPGTAEGPGAFVLHAWNEVVVDNAWRSVDPTWGQTQADATHLPLPPETMLDAIAHLPKLRLRVVDAQYAQAL